MRTFCARAVGLLFGLLVSAGDAGAQTRAADDAQDTLRRCGLSRAGASPEIFAVRCAEWFVARQGYTAHNSRLETAVVVSEGIEWAASKREWLRYRRNSLEPRAVGICVGRWAGYDVVFRARGDSTSARGVKLDATFGALRVQHQDFNLAALRDSTSGCRSLRKGGALEG
jgi:hypothetical protein